MFRHFFVVCTINSSGDNKTFTSLFADKVENYQKEKQEMSVYLFTKLFYLLFLLMCGTLCGQVWADRVTGASASKNTAVLFTKGNIEKIFGPNGDTDENFNAEDFYSPFLVTTDKMIVALTGANRSEPSEKNTDIIARYIEKEKVVQSLKQTTDGDSEKNWQKQFALKEDWEGKDTLKLLLAASTKSKIYILLVNDTTKNPVDSQTVQNYKYTVISGTLTDGTLSSTTNKWCAETTINTKLNEELKSNSLDSILPVGFVLLSKEDFFFVLQFNQKPDGKEIPFALVELGTAEKTVNLATIEAEGECTFKLFTWNKKTMLAKYCGDDSNSMHELEENKKGWKSTSESISRLLPYLKDKHNFTTVTIDEDVLLFTQEKKKPECTDKKSFCIVLWITDGSRLYNVGPIISGKNEVIFAGLLYTKEGLFSLHKQTKESKSIVFTYLDEELKKIKLVLKACKDSDKKVQKFCEATTFLTTACTTDGLVGFLSGKTGQDKEWKDNYLSVDATVDGSEVKINDDNITFSGSDARAMWPVNKANKEQPYSFTNSGFTLVATLTINKNEERIDNSLLGLVVKGKNKRIGLLCAADGKWGVKYGNGEEGVKSSDVACEHDTLYFVGLILGDGKLFVHVNGEELTKLNSGEMTIETSENIDHFYFGADTQLKTKTDVTITNVFLYNRPLPPEEITKFKPKQIQREIVKRETGSDSTTQQEPKGGTIETDKQKSTSATENDMQSSPPTTEDSAVRVGVVGVLCFMLCGVFTLLGRYVY